MANHHQARRQRDPFGARGPCRTLAVAAVVAVAALIAGCGSSGTSSPTTSTVAQKPVTKLHHTRTQTRHTRSGRSHKGTKAASPTSSKTTSKTTGRHAAVPKPVTRPVVHSKQPVISAGAVTSSLSGTGNQSIGTLSEKTTVVLEWSTASPPIQIFNPHGFLLVNSSSATGRVRLARGNYTGLRVAAKGHWTIEVRASA